MLIDSFNDPSNAVLVSSIGTMVLITIAHAIRNLWKKTLQDTLEISDSKSHGDLVETLLKERATHNKNLLDCYDKYNKIVAEYTAILAATKDAKHEIAELRTELHNLKLEIEIQQKEFKIQFTSVSEKLDDALKEKHNLYIENIKLKEQLQNVDKCTK